MKRRALLAFLALPAFAAEHPVTILRRGAAAFTAGDFAAAATNFADAATGAPARELDPAIARYNEGTALLQAGQAGDASMRFAEALRSQDLGLQQKAYFNRGNALMALGRELEAGQQVDDAIKSVQEAQSMYENAMALKSDDADPKINYELAVQREQELEVRKQEQQQQQQQDQQNKDDQKKDEKKDEQDKKQEQQQGDKEKDQGRDKEKQDQKDEQKPEPQDGEKDDQQQPENGQPQNAEEMTPGEASQLLDAMKKAEESHREQVRLIIGQPVPVEKDW